MTYGNGHGESEFTLLVLLLLRIILVIPPRVDLLFLQMWRGSVRILEMSLSEIENTPRALDGNLPRLHIHRSCAQIRMC